MIEVIKENSYNVLFNRLVAGLQIRINHIFFDLFIAQLKILKQKAR